MSLTLSLATEADIPSLTRAQYAAFHPMDTMHVLIYPAPHPMTEAVIQQTVDRQLGYWRADPHITWVKVVDEESGEIVGGAKWIVWPEVDDGEEEKGGKGRWPEKVNVNWVEEGMKGRSGNMGIGVDDKEYVEFIMEEFFERRRERVLGPGALLDICFVDPKWHRRGAGKLLVGWGTEKADELGVKAWVEASYVGRRLYESCGFEVVENVVLRGGKTREEWEEYGAVEYLFMDRKARV